MIKEVFEFNSRILGIKPKPEAAITKANDVFLAKAIGEELKEYVEAISLAEQVDALIDIAYFAIGGLARAGYTTAEAERLFQAVHAANMRKELGVKPGRDSRGTVDAVKPHGWQPPSVTNRVGIDKPFEVDNE